MILGVYYPSLASGLEPMQAMPAMLLYNISSYEIKNDTYYYVKFLKIKDFRDCELSGALSTRCGLN